MQHPCGVLACMSAIENSPPVPLTSDKEESWHGTRSGFSYHGCHCDDCREWRRRWDREYSKRPEVRKRRRASAAARRRAAKNGTCPAVSTSNEETWHGTRGGHTNRGCRCDRCKEWRRNWDREYRKRRKESENPDTGAAARLLALKTDPERYRSMRAKTNEAARKRRAERTPEQIAKDDARLREYRQRPEVRAKRREHLQRPEVKEITRERNRRYWAQKKAEAGSMPAANANG